MEIRQKVWHGSINLEVWYHDQVALICGKRQGYLASYLPQLQHYFGVDETTSFWLETDYGDLRPLAWHIPIGTLFDSYGELVADHQWRLRLQTGEFPLTLLPLMYGPNYHKNLREYLFAQLKQACMVVNGSTKAVMQLSTQNLDQIWRAILATDWNDYWLVMNEILMPTTTKVPVKVYRGTQVSLKVVNGGDLVANVLHEGAIVQGISLPPTMTMAEVWFHFKGLDCFIHVVDHLEPLKLLSPEPEPNSED